MPETFLGQGLIYEEMLPLSWDGGALPQGPVLALFNADNLQLLSAESTLDEVRISDALKEESQALVHELQRLEYKLNILLRLTADLAARAKPLPASQKTRLGERGLEWFGDAAPQVGATGMLHIYINSALPQPLKIPCVVAGQRSQNSERVAQLQFRDMSNAVIEMIEKLIFRHHRRLVAGAKVTSP